MVLTPARRSWKAIPTRLLRRAFAEIAQTVAARTSVQHFFAPAAAGVP